MPSCSPFSPIRRTSLSRISSFTRYSVTAIKNTSRKNRRPGLAKKRGYLPASAHYKHSAAPTEGGYVIDRGARFCGRVRTADTVLLCFSLVTIPARRRFVKRFLKLAQNFLTFGLVLFLGDEPLVVELPQLAQALPNYEAIDKEIITVILNNLGIINIKYQEETTLYDIKPNQLYLNVNESYLLCTRITHKKKKTQFYPYYVLGNLSTTIEWIIKCNKKKKIYLFGSYENIPKLVKNYNFQTIFYYNNYKNFIISKIP